MTPALVALQLGGSSGVRKALGCGCMCIAAVAALPLVLIAALAGALPGSGAGSGIDPASLLVVPVLGSSTGSGEPLQPGQFRVTQGFGCTSVRLEPSPPAPYTCPADPAHPAAVRFHTGIDLEAPRGAAVYAVTDGTVQVIHSATGFGEHIVLTPSPTVTPSAAVGYLYGHLSAVAVPDGGRVRAGAVIGLVGSTGNSTGPHLHFEVDLRGLPVNPCATFPAGYLPGPVAAAGCVATKL